MMTFLKSVQDFIGKWWQLLLGFVVGVFVFLKFEKSTSTIKQETPESTGVLDAALHTQKTIDVITHENDAKIKTIIAVSVAEQKERDEKIKDDAKTKNAVIDNEIQEKSAKDVNDAQALANSIASNFGGESVKISNE